ncbi:hypothetical protein [Prosthecobacter algae]
MKTSFKGSRTKVEKKNPETRMVTYVRGENPVLNITVNGKPIPGPGGALQGICLLHPGNAYALLNFTGTDQVHGFNASDNRLIYFDDFTLDTSDEEEPTDDLNFTVYPGIEQPVIV